MKNSCLVAAIAVISLLGLTEPAGAAVFSRGGGGSGGGSRAAALFAGAAIANRNSSWGDYGDYGGVTYVFSNSPRTDIGMQPGPSESPVQAGMVAPSPPPTTGPSQARANQDWWFQYQGSQAKGGAWAGYSGPELSLPASSYYNAVAQDIGFAAAQSLPRASLDIIKWPMLLRLPAFASRRAQIEAPYRRSPPGLSSPTADDYRAMIKTAEEMKSMLEWISQDGVETNMYEEATKFLDKLEKEARERCEGRSPSPTPKPRG